MFWSINGSIQVSSMDGSDVRTVVDSDIAIVSGLALDRIQERIYWIDHKMKSIETCSYDGMNRFTLYRSNRLIQSPFSLTLFEDRLYWIDTELFALRAMQRHNGSHPITIIGTLRTPRSVIVYQKQLQPDGKVSTMGCINVINNITVITTSKTFLFDSRYCVLFCLPNRYQLLCPTQLQPQLLIIQQLIPQLFMCVP